MKELRIEMRLRPRRKVTVCVWGRHCELTGVGLGEVKERSLERRGSHTSWSANEWNDGTNRSKQRPFDDAS